MVTVCWQHKMTNEMVVSFQKVPIITELLACNVLFELSRVINSFQNKRDEMFLGSLPSTEHLFEQQNGNSYKGKTEWPLNNREMNSKDNLSTKSNVGI